MTFRWAIHMQRASSRAARQTRQGRPRDGAGEDTQVAKPSTRIAPACDAAVVWAVSSPAWRVRTRNIACGRHVADQRERQVGGHRATRGWPPAPRKSWDPNAGRLFRVVFEAGLPLRVVEARRRTRRRLRTSTHHRRTQGGRCCGRGCDLRCGQQGHTRHHFVSVSNIRIWPRYSSRNRVRDEPERIQPRNRHVGVGEVGGLPGFGLRESPRAPADPAAAGSFSPWVSSPPTSSPCRSVRTRHQSRPKGRCPQPGVDGPTTRPAGSRGTPHQARRRRG